VEQARGVVEQAQSTVGQVTDQARQQATSHLEGQKGQAAESIGGMADAARNLGQQLRQQDQPGMARYVEQAADKIQGFSDYLRRTDVNEMLEDAQGFARQQPALFLGGAFLVGLVAARFLKSSAPTTGATGYQPGAMGTRGTFSGQYRSGYAGGRAYPSSSYGSRPATAPSVGTAPYASGAGASTTPYTAGSSLGTSGAAPAGGSPATQTPSRAAGSTGTQFAPLGDAESTTTTRPGSSTTEETSSTTTGGPKQSPGSTGGR
jgi:hypothetical protein